jgi:glycosyltransferase involved in cell wall biosynthesis
MKINVLAHRLIKEDGYGRYALHLMRALAQLGVSVRPGEYRDIQLPAWVQHLQGYDFSHLTLSIMPAYELKGIPGRQWALTMWEDDYPPKHFVDGLHDHAERVIVPCEQNAQALQAAGVSIPIHVVHGGTAPEEFPVLPMVEHQRPYTFLCLGDRGPRKGIETVWSAFFQAFPHEQDVRLLIKARAGSLDPRMAFGCDDARIAWWLEDTDSMADVYPFGDVFVYPAYGDGWGMPPREAAMLGLPVIATNWSGTAVGIENWALPIKKFQLVPAGIPPYIGKWARPDIGEVAQHMRWCYENRAAARAKGQAGAAWLRANQTWQHTARGIVALLEQYS